MSDVIEHLVDQFESRQLSRRELVATLSAIVAGASTAAAQAPANGYTLLVGGLSNIALNAGLYKAPGYSPDDFIPLAEEIGLITAIGEWVLREACKFNRMLLERGFPALRVAINLSARQLQRGGIAETVRVAGTARLSVDPELLASMAVQGKAPKCAIVVSVRQAYLHCAKALIRSKLWSPDYAQPKGAFPVISRMIGDQIGLSEDEKKIAEARTERAYRDGLWEPIT